jgi:AcrR family transcriptional regulator
MSPQLTERERICEALTSVCCEQGYSAATLALVLERAGLDEGAFHDHFDDLEDCFCHLYKEIRDEFMLRVGAAFLAASGWRNQIRAAAYEMFAFLREDSCRARISFVEVLYAGDRAKLIRDEGMQGLFLLIDQGRQEREDPDSLTPFTAETVGGAVYQRVQASVERNDIEALERSVPELLYSVVLPYLGPEVAREELSIPAPGRG